MPRSDNNKYYCVRKLNKIKVQDIKTKENIYNKHVFIFFYKTKHAPFKARGKEKNRQQERILKAHKGKGDKYNLYWITTNTNCLLLTKHYEKFPIQIYRKFYHQTMKNFS